MKALRSQMFALALATIAATANAAAASASGSGMEDMPMSMPMDMPMPAHPKAKTKSKPKPATPNSATSAPARAATPHAAPSRHAAPSSHAQHAVPSTENATPVSMPHDMGSMAMDHDMNAMPPASARANAPLPVPTAADIAAAFLPVTMPPMHGHDVNSYVLLDRLEAVASDHGHGLSWDATAWIGGDMNRLWLRSEGERRDGRNESADLEILYGHSVATWWDVVAGWRRDLQPGPAQDFAALGVMGTAPYKFELSATAYLGRGGQTAARIESEYELPLSGRVYLQPRIELNLYGRDDPRRGIGAGLATLEAGLRLRYEISRQFAPYLGIEHERRFGRTADMARAIGESAGDTRLVAGLRIWF